MPPFDQSWKCFLGDAYVDRWRRKASALYGQEGQAVDQCATGHTA